VTTENSLIDIDYDIRNKPAEPIITSYLYYGPPFESCAAPEVTIIDSDGVTVDFLSAAYNQTTQSIDISINNAVVGDAEKGDYVLFAQFTEPGDQ
jgi:hypothetical protein